jgi:hypothetical protein
VLVHAGNDAGRSASRVLHFSRNGTGPVGADDGRVPITDEFPGVRRSI